MNGARAALYVMAILAAAGLAAFLQTSSYYYAVQGNSTGLSVMWPKVDTRWAIYAAVVAVAVVAAVLIVRTITKLIRT
jgi:hypothetical protein